MARYKNFYKNDEFFKWFHLNRGKVNVEFVKTYKDKINVKYTIIPQKSVKCQ